jgi:hypothetical protein
MPIAKVIAKSAIGQAHHSIYDEVVPAKAGTQFRK